MSLPCSKYCNVPQKELSIELAYDPAIPLLGIHPKELKAGTQTGVWTLSSQQQQQHSQQPKGGSDPSVHR